MKCRNWKAFEDSFEILQWDKNSLFELAYGKDYSGIDFTIPQYWVDQEKPVTTFYLATDCTLSLFRIVDLRDVIPDFIALKVIRAGEIMKEAKELPLPHKLSKIEEMQNEYCSLMVDIKAYKEML